MTSATRTAITVAAAAFAFCATALPGTASADPDVTPPVVTILGFPSANETAGTFVFDADEAVLSYQCQLDSRPSFVCVSPTFVSGLAEGPHTFSVSAIDLAGNPGAAAVYAWVADFTPPSAPSITAPASGTWTNATQPTITGTAEANATVRVFDGTELLGSTIADSLGDWSFTPTAPLSDGTYLIRARARDAANNESSPSAARTINIDTVSPPAPQILAPTTGAKTNGPALVVSGSAEAHATVAVEVDSTTVGSGAAGATGDWSVDPSPVPADGSRVATAVATDRAGNVGPVSSQVTFELESVPPPAPTLTSPLDGAAFAVSSVQFTGTADGSSTVRLYRGDVEFTSGVAEPDGSWSLTETLPDGTHVVTATATDEYGNESDPSAAVTITVDTTPPVAQIISGPQSPTNQTSASISFMSEPNVEFECKLDLDDWISCDSPETFTVTEGDHEVSVRATDQLGNIGVGSVPYAWTVDLTPPAAPTITSPVDGGRSTDLRPLVSGAAEPESQVELFVNGATAGTAQVGPTGDWNLAPTGDLDQGDSTLTAVATDDAGNDSAASSPVELSVDSVFPTTTFTSGPPATWDATSAGFLFGADEDTVTFRCRLDGAPWDVCSSPYLVGGLRYGGHIFEVYATDDFGNVEPTVRRWEWRTAQAQPDESAASQCRFRRSPIGPVAVIGRIRASAKVPSRPVVSFSADRAGIARVTIVRRGRTVVRADVQIERGGNAARLKLSKKVRRAGNVRVNVSSVSLGAGYFGSSVAAKFDRRGRLSISTRVKPRDGAGCSEDRASSPPPRLRIVSVAAVAGGAVRVTISSDQLVVVRSRAEDSNAGSDSETEVVFPRRRVTLVVPVPAGLADPGTNAAMHVVAFNGALSQAAVTARIPGS